MRAVVAAAVLVSLFVSGCFGGGADSSLDDSTPIEGATGGFSDTDVFPGDYFMDGGHSHPLQAGPYEVLDPEVVDLVSDADGAQIEIGFFRPDLPPNQKAPVIVYAAPYVYSGMSDPEDLKESFQYGRLVQNFGPHGYAVAFVPTRGSGDAGGCSDLMGPLERADLDQAITWLGEQEWSNGNVAMIGLSYVGSTAWQVAAAGNPHLKTIVPVAAVSDWFDLMYKNGTSDERGRGDMVTGYYADYGFVRYNPVYGTRSPANTVEGIVCPAAAEGAAASLYTFYTGERDPLGFWADRNSRPGVEANYDGSVFAITGLLDRNVDPSHAYPWLNKLESQGIPVKHLLGQWAHEFPDTLDEDPRADLSEILLHWFDYWLKGDTSVDLGPRVQVQDNTGRWRSEDAWPASDSTEIGFYLAPEGKLVEEDDTSTGQELVGIAGHGWVDFTIDEEYVCPACPAFTTGSLDEPLRLAGVPKVHVTVSPTGPGGHIAAWLYVVEDGARTPVGWGQIDLRFADGGEVAKAVTPGEPVVARMVLEPLDVVVPPGASLELEFHQGTYTDHEPSVPTYPVHLHYGSDESVFRIHTFERSEADFFVPPSG